MKSAYELAMNRLGGKLEAFSPEQKRRLADLNSVYEAKIAQVKLQADAELQQAAQDAEKQNVVRARMAAEVTELTAERERKRELLRKELLGGR